MSDNPFRDALLAAFEKFNVTDSNLRAAIAAVCFGESGFQPRTEKGYSGTDNARIRALFGSRVANLTDDQLNVIKSNDEVFFDIVYGGSFGRSQLGNIYPGDGYKYRGRGGIQLTGRGNYLRSASQTGIDLISNPDRANDPATAALIAVAYVLAHSHDTYEEVKRSVGNAVAVTEEVKDKAYADFVASGEWNSVSA